MDKKDFIKNNKDEIKKSYDFRDVAVSIDPADQLLAESTVCSEKIKYIKEQMALSKNGDLCEVKFADGVVKLYEKDNNLYSGYFLDNEGQVEDKYDDVTPEILAKYLDIKDIGEMVEYVEPVEELVEESSEMESEQPTSIKIKYGDFELEIKKSLTDFVRNNKDLVKVNSDLKKAIRSYNKSTVVKSKNDTATARKLLENWDKDKEGFFQMLHGIKIIKNK